MTTVRLDVKTATALSRLTMRRGQTKSEVIHDASARLAEEEGGAGVGFSTAHSFIGIVDSGGRQLSDRTGQKLRELLEEKRRKE